MPLDLKAHAPKSATLRELTVPLEAYEGEESVALSYDPKRYNASIEVMVTEHFEDRPAQTCRAILTTFVGEWDLKYDGEPIPITEKGLTFVPLFEVQVPLVNAIMTDMAELGKELQNDSQPSLSTAKQQPPKSRAKGRSRLTPVS